jgi:sulfoxide reductase catalytic subunit YedY
MIKNNIKESEVTDYKHYLNRRAFIGGGLAITAGVMFSKITNATTINNYLKNKNYGKGLEPHSYEEITGYNNFYEFGTGKRDPEKNAKNFKTKPWNVTVAGECKKTGTFLLEDIIKNQQLEERIYRLRCVEAWSMVIPWLGVSVASVLKKFEPNSKAKYVKFTTLLDKEQMPGQKRPILDWLYVEGLTIKEAMNPLSFFAVGLYGKELPNQNGAPIRLVVPWKYGFKSIKSIVKIEFSETRPINSWQQQAPNEYGFYANVNPKVDHPRWSQKRERIIGRGGFFSPEKRDTELFNGYQAQVAHLYKNLDLAKNF